MNAAPTLEFVKDVLSKVSFDRVLFKKELKKAIQWLKEPDLSRLKQWCLATFASQYEAEIKESFLLS